MKQNKILTALGFANSTAQHSTAQHSTAHTNRQLAKRIVQISAFTVSCLVALPSFAQVSNYCDLGMSFMCGTGTVSPPVSPPSNPYDPFNPFNSYPSNPTIPDSPCWITDTNCGVQDSSVDNGYGG